MAKFFGNIDEEDIKDLPQSVQDAIKAGSANADTVASLQEKIVALEKRPTGAPAAPTEPAAPTWNPPCTRDQEILCDTRMDTFLMKISQGRDKLNATCVQLFETEIKDNLTKSHPFNRADEKYVINIIDLVKGRHMQEILADMKNADADKKFGSIYTESGSTNAPNSPVVKSPGESLTAEQRKAADMWGISYDEFAKSHTDVNGATA